jgi:PAS domain S-box-containing protein
MMKKAKTISVLIITALSVWLSDAALRTFVFQAETTPPIFNTNQAPVYFILYLIAFLLFGVSMHRIFLEKEETLRENEKRYGLLLQRLQQGVWVFDKDGRTTYANPSIAKMLGYSADEMLGKSFYSFLVEKNVGIANQDHGLDLEFVRKNGSRVFARVSPTLFTGRKGDCQEIVASVMDIEERKRLEDKLKYYSERLEDLVVEKTKSLRESEKKYRRLIENIPDIAWTCDHKGDIAFISPKVETLCGYTQVEIQSGGFDFWLEKVHRDDVEHVRSAYELLFRRNQNFDIEYRIMRKNGELIWVSDRTGETHEKDGELYTDGVFSDITERKRMEEMLRRSERMAVIGETAAMVGHDLRNPLQTMLSRLYLVKKGMGDSSQSRSEVTTKLNLNKTLDEFERLVQYMNKIVSDLQDYARPLVPTLVETDLEYLLENTLSTITVPEAIRISVDIDPSVRRILVDSTLMMRLLTNLVTNAIQAMPNGGQLTITGSSTDENAVISIRDTGCGITTENLNKLFTPLYTTKSKGMGLGLAVAERLAKAHGGTITVDSQVGDGTTFTIKIPCLKRKTPCILC